MLNQVSLQVHAGVHCLYDDDHLGHLAPLVAQILLLQKLRGDFEPVLEVPSEFFLVEVDLLLYLEVVLHSGAITLSWTMSL